MEILEEKNGDSKERLIKSFKGIQRLTIKTGSTKTNQTKETKIMMVVTDTR